MASPDPLNMATRDYGQHTDDVLDDIVSAKSKKKVKPKKNKVMNAGKHNLNQASIDSISRVFSQDEPLVM